jgi:hypothetical protein
MKVGVMLNPSLHWIDDYKIDKECKVVEEKTVQQILEKLLVGVLGEVERVLMDQKRMKGLDEINWEGWEWWANGWKLEHSCA